MNFTVGNSKGWLKSPSKPRDAVRIVSEPRARTAVSAVHFSELQQE